MRNNMFLTPTLALTITLTLNITLKAGIDQQSSKSAFIVC